jgi:hypothetical protein
MLNKAGRQRSGARGRAGLHITVFYCLSAQTIEISFLDCSAGRMGEQVN